MVLMLLIDSRIPTGLIDGLLGMHRGLSEASLVGSKGLLAGRWSVPELPYRFLGGGSGSLGFPWGSLGGRRGAP